MVKRYPDEVTIKYNDEGTVSPATGVYTPGTETEALFTCRMEPNAFKSIIDTNGDKIIYSYTCYFPPNTSGLGDIPKGARLIYGLEKLTVMQVPNYQKQKVLYCG